MQWAYEMAFGGAVWRAMGTSPSLGVLREVQRWNCSDRGFCLEEKPPLEGEASSPGMGSYKTQASKR